MVQLLQHLPQPQILKLSVQQKVNRPSAVLCLFWVRLCFAKHLCKGRLSVIAMYKSVRSRLGQAKCI